MFFQTRTELVENKYWILAVDKPAQIFLIIRSQPRHTFGSVANTILYIREHLIHLKCGTGVSIVLFEVPIPTYIATCVTEAIAQIL